MAIIKWTSASLPVTILSTELNSLSSGSTTGSGAVSLVVSNTQANEHDTFVTLELYIAQQGANRAVGGCCEVFFLPTLDGVNFPFGADGTIKPAPSCHVGTFSLDSPTSGPSLVARWVIIPEVKLPPHDFIVALWNSSGQNLAPSGNILRMSRYNPQSVS